MINNHVKPQFSLHCFDLNIMREFMHPASLASVARHSTFISVVRMLINVPRVLLLLIIPAECDVFWHFL